jgi:hypothetical protein
MPPEIEKGLLSAMGTIEAQGARANFGVPPPSERDLDWARMHLLLGDPEFSGKVRVWLKNLQQGGDPLPAYRNAFTMTPQQVNEKAKAYLQAGQFSPVSINAKTIDPNRDFPGKPADPLRVKVALADASPTEAAYKAINSTEAKEGLAWLALRADSKRDAINLYNEAIDAGSKSAVSFLETGKPKEAIPLNPRWSEPFLRMAYDELDFARRAELLRRAAALEPRNAKLWRETAKVQLEAKQWAEAARSWAAAERAAANPEERKQIEQARSDFSEQVAASEAAERLRIAEEKQKELDRLKAESEARVREAEVRANARNGPPLEPGKKVEEWWDAPRAEGKLQGKLEKVDCLPAGKARVWIRPEGGKLTALLIRDPNQVVITGGGETALSCGVQKPPKTVNAEFHAKPDAKLGTQGDLAILEFQAPAH